MEKRIWRCDPQKQRYWEDVVRRWRDGGQTVRAFCRANGLQESAFYFWRRELAKRKGPCKKPVAGVKKGGAVSKKSGPAFLPVRVVAPASHANDATCGQARGGVEIVLAEGRVVRVVPGFDRQTLADVLSLLEARPC